MTSFGVVSILEPCPKCGADYHFDASGEEIIELTHGMVILESGIYLCSSCGFKYDNKTEMEVTA